MQLVLRYLCRFFSTFRRCSRNRSSNLLPVLRMKIFLYSVQVIHFTCIFVNVIYCITCSLCKKIYIGKTGRRLADRFREHLRNVETNDTDASKPVAGHFQTFLSNCLVYSPEKVQVTSMGLEPITSVMPVQCYYQLSYKVSQLRDRQFVGHMCSRERNERMKESICEVQF